MPSAEHAWRCFVAIPIGDGLRAALDGCSKALQARPGAEDWRWTDASAWHVTLAFMGATEPAAIPRVSATLAATAATIGPFTVEAGGLGAFSSRRRARVLWFGIADPDGRLRRLARAVRRAVELPVEDRFRGHLTLARLRSGLQADASDLLDAASAPATPLVVDRIIFYRSHLGRGPARYEELSVAPLTGDVA